MATVVYQVKPNPLEGFAQAMGTLANALQQRWERQATLEDMTILGEVLSGKNLSPEIVTQAMQRMRTPAGAQLLNQVLQKAALEASNIWAASPGSMILRGTEPIGQVPERGALTPKVVPLFGTVFDPTTGKFLTPPPTEYQQRLLDVKQQELEARKKSNVLKESELKGPKGRAAEIEYWINKLGLSPTPDNVNLVRGILYGDKGKTREEIEQNLDKLAIDLTKAWAYSQIGVSEGDISKKFQEYRMLVRGMMTPPAAQQPPGKQTAPAQGNVPPNVFQGLPEPGKFPEGFRLRHEVTGEVIEKRGNAWVKVR